MGLGKGRKTKEWEKARRLLKVAFEQVEITTCELRFLGCMNDFGLSWAHSKKRADIVGDEIYEVVLGCANCHPILEAMGKKCMLRVVKKVIDERLVQPRILP